jgi:hypothetical protein
MILPLRLECDVCQEGLGFRCVYIRMELFGCFRKVAGREFKSLACQIS